MKRRSYKKQGIATQESIEEAKARKRQFQKGSKLFNHEVLTPSQLVAERKKLADKNIPSVKLPRIISANISGQHFNLKKGVILEMANREKITGAHTVNDLLAISGAFDRLSAFKRFKIDVNSKISNVPKKQRELIFNELVSKMKVKDSMKSDIRVTALAKALNLF